MKLPIKKVYFDQIKEGKKKYEYRDAHITFVCEETGETLRKEVISVYLQTDRRHLFPDVLNNPWTIVFGIKDERGEVLKDGG